MDTTIFTNLSNLTILTTTQFFNQLDIQNNGYVLVQQILDYLVSKNIPETTVVPLWLQNFVLDNQLDDTLQITYQIYESYKAQNSQFNIDFYNINTDNNDFITINDLYNTYAETYLPQINSTYFWFQNIVNTYSLNSNTQLTLEQLLTYENSHNTTHSWF